VDIKKEFYLGCTLDRASEKIVMIASSEGGVEIEKLAEEKPELIKKIYIDPLIGVQDFQLRNLAYGLFDTGLINSVPNLVRDFVKIARAVYSLFVELDASLVEINPLVLTEDDELIAIDSKLNLDDNASFRHPEWNDWFDPSQVDPVELKATKIGLNFVKLDGNIGCMVNGAGLAMATMDEIAAAGGKAANFLDVGGTATVDRIKEAFKILALETDVSCILVNIFGGIVRCDRIAAGIKEAVEEIGLDSVPPTVIRMRGTNYAEGVEVLQRSLNNKCYIFEDLKEAVEAAVAIAEGKPINLQKFSQESFNLKSEKGSNLLNINKIIVQGITGREGSFHASRCLLYGSKIVGGVVPGKGSTTIKFEAEDKEFFVPVYNSVAEAVDQTGADTSLVFVPAPFAKDAILEAVEAGIKNVVVITEGIPVKDMLEVKNFVQRTYPEVKIVGPNCPGLMIPGIAKVGIMPASIFTPGKIAVISRSGTLTYEVVNLLSSCGMGQSFVIGIGGDPIIGSNYLDILELLKDDPHTAAVVMIGEIGGSAEEAAADYIKNTNYPKPVVAYIAGKSAPQGRRMGHAGAIVEGGKGDAISKQKYLETRGIKVALRIHEIPTILREALSNSTSPTLEKSIS